MDFEFWYSVLEPKKKDVAHWFAQHMFGDARLREDWVRMAANMTNDAADDTAVASFAAL